MAVLPVVVKLPAVTTAAKRNDRVGATHGPEHPGALETRSHHGFAACLDDAGAYKQLLLAELGIAHAFGITFEVARLGSDRYGQFGIVRAKGP